MKKINCLIVDDEPLALALLESYISKTPFLELKGKCSNAFEAIEQMSKHRIDLLYLDIQMPDLSGLELSRTLKNGPRIIFTTAFEKYALDGFKLDAIDYLLKPFNYEEFLRASTKANEWFTLRSNQSVNTERNSFLYVKSEYKQVKIDLKKVLFIEGLKDYVKIHVQGAEKSILSLMTLKSLEEQLPNWFMRIHRSYIINLEMVDAVERTHVLIGKHQVKVAEQYKDQFWQYLDSKSMKTIK